MQNGATPTEGEFLVESLSEEDAFRIWSAGREAMGPLPTEGEPSSASLTPPAEGGGEPLRKQLLPLVDDVFLSLFLGGRDPKKDVAAILWRHLMMGRSGRIRRPFHVAWAMLRRIAQVNPILGMCIRFFVQEFRTLNWTVEARRSEYQKMADIAKLLLRFPNPVDTWTTFLDKIVIDLLTLDAAPVEVWYGKFIPFQIAWEKTRLQKLEKALEQLPADDTDPYRMEIKRNMQISALRLGMLHSIMRERIPLMLSYSQHYSEDVRAFEKLVEASEKLEKGLRDSPLSPLEMCESEIWDEKLMDYAQEGVLAKAEEGDATKSPLHLPIAFVPIPGDQIECWGDIELGLLDFEFPYRRVLFERVIGKYTQEQLIYLREFNRTDSFYGISPVEAVLLVAYTFLIAHDVQFRYFTRSNIPAGILAISGATNINQIRQKLREMLVSPERIAVIAAPPGPQGGLQWIPLANINREIQFTEIINWYVKLMVLAFGLQTWEIGLESGNVNKRQLRIRPGVMGRMRFLESAINDLFLIKTFKLDPSALQFYFHGIDVGDFAEEANVVNNLVYKLMSIDEARARLGLPPLQNGLSDYLFAPSGSGVFLMGKIRRFVDEEIDYDVPEKSVGMWTAIAGGMPKGLETGGGMFPAGPALLKARELVQNIPQQNSDNWLRKFSEKQRGAVKNFAKAMAALEVVSDPLEGVRFAYYLYQDLAKWLKREPKWAEYSAYLGHFIYEAYNKKLSEDIEKFKEGIEPLEAIL